MNTYRQFSFFFEMFTVEKLMLVIEDWSILDKLYISTYFKIILFAEINLL